jgi:hypothetical protein
MTEFSSNLQEFVESWDHHSNETTKYLDIEVSQTDYETFEKVHSSLDDLSDYIGELKLTIGLEADRYRYKIHYNIVSENISIEKEYDEEVSPEQAYDDPDLADKISDIREEDIVNLEQLKDALEVLSGKEPIEISLSTKLWKRAIIDELDAGTENTQFYFKTDKFFRHIEESDVEETREKLFNNNLRKTAIIILDLSGNIRTRGLIILGIDDLECESHNKFLGNSKSLRESEERIGRNSMIEGFENFFIPPEAFEVKHNDSEISEDRFYSLFNPHRLLFSLLAFSDTSKREEDFWKLRIRGKKLLESKIRLAEDHLEIKERESPVEIDNEVSENIYSLYEWVYLSRKKEVDNRITVLRNVITLHCQDVYDLVVDSKEVFESVKSNYRYYVEQSVDKFVDFKQEFMSSAFETHHKASDLRNKLMDDLASDLFRTFSYIIVMFVIMTSTFGNPLKNSLVYSASLFPLFFYIVAAYYRIESLESQFEKLKEQEENHEDFYKKFFNDKDFDRIKNGDKLGVEGEFGKYAKVYRLVLIGIFILGIIILVAVNNPDNIFTGLLDQFSQIMPSEPSNLTNSTNATSNISN